MPRVVLRFILLSRLWRRCLLLWCYLLLWWRSIVVVAGVHVLIETAFVMHLAILWVMRWVLRLWLSVLRIAILWWVWWLWWL